MQFIKAHCGGNDFVIFDSRLNSVPTNLTPFVKHLADRHTGIGADGIIFIEPTNGADFGLRYFNPDGSEYGICGNGTLCVLLYTGKSEASFKTASGILKGCVIDNKVRVKIPPPKNVILSLPLTIKKSKLNFSFVDIGVPHTILFVKDVTSIDVSSFAHSIRFHPHFGADGTNVNFVQILGKNKISIRTYERGIEGETLSCGSGTCASAIVGWLKGDLLSPIEVNTQGGTLWVYIAGLEEIWLQGIPELVYKGELLLYKGGISESI
ncbi:MAG: diaminopimelate epimerase [bacterium]|nr:diaminopimelate epimerase [bacterium]